MAWWRMRLDRGSGLLAGELASPWRCLLLGGVLPSTGLRLLPLAKCGIAEEGGWYSTVAPPSAVEPSSWLEWPERSPSMLWL
jgi:hypothetical protein